MPYSNLEILTGVLVVACLLLAYCSYNKRSAPTAEGLRHGADIPGLHMRNGFSSMPKAWALNSEGLRSSYSTRTHKSTEGLDNQGLNDQSIRQTPASAAVDTPRGTENRILWDTDAEIPLDVYTRDGVLNSHEFDPDSAANMYKEVFERNSSRAKVAGSGSVTGCQMRGIDIGDNMSASRALTN